VHKQGAGKMPPPCRAYMGIQTLDRVEMVGQIHRMLGELTDVEVGDVYTFTRRTHQSGALRRLRQAEELAASQPGPEGEGASSSSKKRKVEPTWAKPGAMASNFIHANPPPSSLTPQELQELLATTQITWEGAEGELTSFDAWMERHVPEETEIAELQPYPERTMEVPRVEMMILYRTIQSVYEGIHNKMEDWGDAMAFIGRLMMLTWDDWIQVANIEHSSPHELPAYLCRYPKLAEVIQPVTLLARTLVEGRAWMCHCRRCMTEHTQTFVPAVVLQKESHFWIPYTWEEAQRIETYFSDI
jgi:hypothetical protein